jgi:2'-5' RNA ligase
MFYALNYYPKINNPEFHRFRNKYEPFSKLIVEHLTFVFPTPAEIGFDNLRNHISEILKKWQTFDIHLNGIEKTWDNWMFLSVKEGNSTVIQLHDDLYTGILKPYFRKDLPYTPHIGLGYFGIEEYDFYNPKAKTTLNERMYKTAFKEFKEMNFSHWCTVNELVMCSINDDFTRTEDVDHYELST